MNIQIAKHSGFCSGVDRAYKIAIETSKKGLPVYILGLLVHNSQVISKLELLGIKSVKSVSEIPKDAKGSIIISAHGVGPKVYKEVEKIGLYAIDTTCPWVKKAQSIARSLAQDGYQVVIVGDKNHTEVKGIMEWAGEGTLVLEKETDADSAALSNKIGVVAQTTQSLENFNSVVAKLKSKAKEVVVHNTICDATSKMQNSAVEVAKKSDVMLVIGDFKSANTKRLKELCKETGTVTYHIQDASELNVEWLKNKENIGISAGASTPDWVVSEVVNKIRA